MLVALSIRNLVLIDRLDLEPRAGCTALTGETGAGKSILLDGLGLALGAPAERRLIGARGETAHVTAEFEPPTDHPVWRELDAAGLDAPAGETVTLKRILKTSGPSRALVNDQPVSAALLAKLGETLAEIHGQHAASALMRPSAHRSLLDQFAGNETLLTACGAAWQRLTDARDRAEALASNAEATESERAGLQDALAFLDELAPRSGEVDALATRRAGLMQTERIGEALGEADGVLQSGNVGPALARAARAMETVQRLPGLDRGSHPLAETAFQASEALERALVELGEAEAAMDGLRAASDHDPTRLEDTEARLFALKAAARRFGVEPDELEAERDRLGERLAALESHGETLADARNVESAARADWQRACKSLGQARRAAATRLETAIAAELAPLKLERVRLRVAVDDLDEADAGPRGADRVEFEAETNPAAGFLPLRQVASGGELTRVSLAMKCALAEAGTAGLLVFDEADQGVGGSVAAAIGERLSRLAVMRQVLAVTHSPQVAAAADTQWRITKEIDGQGLGRTCMNGLDAEARREEIARMLAGAEVTKEARAAAARLLEEGCPKTPLSVT